MEERHHHEEKRPKPPKKKGGAGRFFAGFITGVVFTVLVMLVLSYLGFGFGGGSGSGSGSSTGSGEVSAPSQQTDLVSVPEKQTTEQQEEKPETAEQTAEGADPVVVIEVSGDAAAVNGEQFSDAEALKAYLVTINKDDSVYILRDNRAVKELYDAVEAMLAELHYSYTAETV